MVRVVSQGFTTPRSRHSSGEDMIDRFAAMKAVPALNDNEKQFFKDGNCTFEAKKLVIDCNTDTNDSFSCGDSEEDARSDRGDERGQQGTYQGGSSSGSIKKERRRERNKLSAQSYRQRRKVQTSAVQKTLECLEAQHKVLLEKVRHLEAEKTIVEEYLRTAVKMPCCPSHQPPQHHTHTTTHTNTMHTHTHQNRCKDPCQPMSPSCNLSVCTADSNANMVINKNHLPASLQIDTCRHPPASMANLNDMSLCMSAISSSTASQAVVS